MAAGRAIVASDIHGYKKVVQRNVTGLLVEPKDEAALCGALARLVEDPALRERFGAAGAERATEFDWAHVTAELVDVYEEVLERRARGV
jgi:phosphatidylinositol alpha-mannosyltransferase